MSNPYQAFFDRVDECVAALEAAKNQEGYNWEGTTAAQASDLLRRAAFVLADQINTAARSLPALILEPEVVEAEATDADSRSTSET